jgi:RimJ/RimL family protein N-acetyltransferase
VPDGADTGRVTESAGPASWPGATIAAMHHDLELTSPDVHLVPLAAEHAAALAAFTDETVWHGMTTPTPTGPDDVLALVDAALATPGRYAFAVLDAATGDVVGSTSFYDVDRRLARLEIGHTWYAPRVWGTRVNPACKLALLTHAFDVWGMQRVAFRADARNARSIAAITRLGAVPEGRLRSHRVRPDGTRSDTVYFAILADEWPAARAGLEGRLAGHPQGEHSHLLVVGGRSGVGKSTAAFALHDLLTAHDVRHAVVEGDALDLAHPFPAGAAADNLRAIWSRYRALGYRRLVVTNTVAVLEADAYAAAMGDAPLVTSVLLTADDDTARDRLARREHGASYDAHVTRSDAAARRLEAASGPEIHRLRTDGRTPAELAAALAHLTGWLEVVRGPEGDG